MKRIIKFRGKDLKTGEWLYGSLVFDCDKKPMIFVSGYSHTGLGFSGASYVDPETVGQFTGLTDKNGKEIYEGDIVSWLFFHGSLEVGKVEYKREEAQFRIVNRYTTMDNRESTTTIQNKRDLMVRGNIHDTPELLNEK